MTAIFHTLKKANVEQLIKNHRCCPETHVQCLVFSLVFPSPQDHHSRQKYLHSILQPELATTIPVHELGLVLCTSKLSKSATAKSIRMLMSVAHVHAGINLQPFYPENKCIVTMQTDQGKADQSICMYSLTQDPFHREENTWLHLHISIRKSKRLSTHRVVITTNDGEAILSSHWQLQINLFFC